MAASLQSQRTALRTVADARPDQLVRAGLALRTAQAELLRSQIEAAVKTIEIVAGDERIRRYVEKALNHEPS